MKKRSVISLGVAFLLLTFGIVFAAPANAADGDWFKNDAAPTWCAQETSTSSGVFLDPCSTNHSDLWFSEGHNSLEIVNEHSGFCLTSHSNGTVNLTTCSATGDNASQLWEPQLICDSSIGGWIYVSQYGVLWQSVKSLQVRNPAIDFSTTNPHDCWAFFAP